MGAEAIVDPSLGLLQKVWELANNSSIAGAVFLGISVGVFLILRIYASKTYKLLSAHLETQTAATEYFREQHTKYEAAVADIRSGVAEIRTGVTMIADKVDMAEIEHKSHEKEVGEIHAKVDELMRGGEGNMNEQQVVKMVAAKADQIHVRLQFWWQKRVEANHIIDEPELVQARYGDKLDDILKKFVGELSGYRYRGQPLTAWDSGEGLRKFYEEVLRLLYSIQHDLASGKEPVYQPGDLDSVLDRKQSALMAGVREWVLHGTPLVKFLETNSHEKGAGRIEWLIPPPGGES